MNQSYKQNDLLILDNPVDLRALYTQYADKLLGYILPIVHNRQLAEDCLVKLFSHLSSAKNVLPANTYSNTWSWLITLANKEIDYLGEAAKECKTVINNTTYIDSHKYLFKMTEAQREVFCGVYYHRKTTAAMATDLNLPEQELRLRLKEAFMIIRGVKDEN